MKSVKALGIFIVALTINSLAQADGLWMAPDCYDYGWGSFVNEIKTDDALNDKNAELSLYVKDVTIENMRPRRYQNAVWDSFARKDLFFVKPALPGQKWTLAIADGRGGHIDIGTIEESISQDVEYWSHAEKKKIPMACHRVQLYNNLKFKDQYVGKKWSAGGIALIIPVAGTTEQISLKLSAYDASTGVSNSVLAKPNEGDYRFLGIFNTSSK